MRLFGADVSTQSYPLSVAYISLNVTREASTRRKTAADITTGVQRVDIALRDTSRLLLRGAPGSGKTTLLHWLAVRAAGDDFPDQLISWSGAIPFFVPLREYAEKELPDPSAFLRHAGIHLSATSPTGWVEQILAEGRALLLIDGIDELPRERRENARIWLRNLISDFSACRYIVTTRSAATAPDWLAAEDFDTAVLEPLTPNDIDAFVRHWHSAVTSETVETDERRILERNQQYLVSTIISTRHLLNLARTPLLCALLCALYRDRHAVLPRDRAELYEAALAMLLERRDVERGIDVSGIDLSRREKTFLLQELAYWLITNGLTEAAVSIDYRAAN
jgi:predicted NACHT family NTPase